MKIRQIWEVQKFPEFKFLNLLDKKTRQNTDVITIFPKSLGDSGGSGGLENPSDLGGPKVPGV